MCSSCRARRRQRFFARIGGLAGYELRMRRIGDHHREAQLRRRQRQVLIKGRHGRNAMALDLTTSTGRAMAGMLSVFAAFEHNILRDRGYRNREILCDGVQLGRKATHV